MKRPFISTVMLLCSLLTFAQFSGTVYDSQGVRYTANNDGLTCYVSGHKNSYSATITIPEAYEGRQVTSIGEDAFEYCSGLMSVTIPSSVTSIGNYAFYNCSSLTSVVIPSSVTSIGDNAFEYTPWFINQPDGLVYINNVAYQYKGTMSQNTIIIIKEGTLSISGSAFYNCSSLTSVVIPSSVTSIGERAFAYCSGLTSVTIPSSVTSIGEGTFEYCSSLTSTVIPSSVTLIGNYAFYECRGLTSLMIPSSVTSIGEGTFEYCSSLTSVVIPSSVTSIGKEAFAGCYGLTSVTIPSSVTSIGHGAFSGCRSLTSVTIPSSVTSIGNWAFAGCSGLSSLIIPSSVTSIGEYAFSYCSALAHVYCFANDVPSTDLDAFEESNIASATLHVPAIALDAYKTTEPWSGFGNNVAIEDDDLQYYLNSLADTEDTFTGNVYQRKFKNGDWQSLCVPFAMNYSDWSDWFEVGSIDEIAQYDDNNDGLTDRQEVKCTMIESGSTEANQPYFIRAKKKSGATLSVDVSQQNQLAASKTFTAGQTTYTITGNYTPLSGMKTAGQYRMKGGSLWIPTSDTEVLPPYRWYLTISGESPVSGARLAVTTNQEGVTAINEKMKTGNGNDGRLYDLQGRRINTPYHTGKGLYIKDGKKYVVK